MSKDLVQLLDLTREVLLCELRREVNEETQNWLQLKEEVPVDCSTTNRASLSHSFP